MRRPSWSITVEGIPVPAVDKRLSSLSVTQQSGFSADELELEIDAGDVIIPPAGAEIAVAVGMEDASLGVGTFIGAVSPSAPRDLGTYTVTEIEHSGPPNTLRIRGRSADVAGSLMAQRTQSYDHILLDALVTTIAGRHGLQPVIGLGLSGTLLEHIDQTEESDAHLLTRLAEDHDAIATVKNGRLLFVRRGRGVSASGLPMPPAALRRDECGPHRYQRVENPTSYTGVRARWYDREEARAHHVLAGESGNLRVLKDIYPNERSAYSAAEAEWRRLQRGGVSLSVQAAIGRPEIGAETPVTLLGEWPAEVVAQSWIVASSTHRLDRGSGLTTALELYPYTP
ncbi:contractile injection system protein, VgrG/Pvc8 family [Halorhodospira neutriphila]|uniref:Phage late control D family protein n=1 Tax=Halorhodospira neutriphila TaxID=168379 RepID=A0ABS1E1R7_9GAMM|nr:contractile injection system protein, VgrG/Pvc8 family [Halorhodospira neutriphila]MBK1725730.1 hypothetical protein [Halorhodospira neutriphila]